jgi:hypothetical protein
MVKKDDYGRVSASALACPTTTRTTTTSIHGGRLHRWAEASLRSMTLVSIFFSENCMDGDFRSFSQLLVRSIASLSFPITATKKSRHKTTQIWLESTRVVIWKFVWWGVRIFGIDDQWFGWQFDFTLFYGFTFTLLTWRGVTWKDWANVEYMCL